MAIQLVESKMRAYCKNCDFVGKYHQGANAEELARADGKKHETSKPTHTTGVEVSQKHRKD